MIVGASALTAWVSKDITFPAILCMLGLLGLRGRFIWNIPPRRRSLTPLLLLVLAILFALHCRYTHVRSNEAAAFAWETIARYFLASMILVLYLRSQDGRVGQGRTRDARRTTYDEGPATNLPASLGLFQLAAVLAAGQVLLLDDQYLAFRLFELLSVTLAVLYAAAGRVADDGPAGKGRTCWTYGTNGGFRFQASHIALLLLAVNVGWVAGSLLYRRVETLNLLPAWFWRGAIVMDGMSDGAARIGFSTSGRLSSILEIKEDPDTTPVLKVTCDGAPGYLRARAFETYLRSEWLNQSPAESIFPEQNAPLFGLPLLGRTYRFRLNDKSAPRSMIVRHEMMIADAIFTPLGISSIEAPFRSLERYDDDILRPYSRSGSPGYRITYSTSGNAGPPDGTQMRGMLGLPALLDPRIHQLAGKIFAGCRTTAEKIEAVVDYFRTNYTYSLVMDIPPEEDKLEYFLLSSSSGYCEYFASGAAILLRLAEVPTRYVTGFLVTERGEQSNSWIARNMDAHAWVEAWDEEQNEWTIVEATVQEELGEGALDEESAYQRGRGAMFLAQFLQALYDYGLFGVLAWLFESYSLVTALSVSLAFLGAATCLALWRRYRRIHSQGRGSEHRQEILALRRILAAMDRKVRAAGLRRQSSETLHAFAERIRRSSLVARRSNERHEERSFADWYLAYADLRYCRAISPEQLRQLQRFAQDLRRAR